MRPAKTQVSLLSTQSDQSLRCPHEETLGPKLPIECEDSDQIGRMAMLIRVFAGSTVI